MPLAGCSLFHSNVKGGFVCSAPRGTCAPSTTIDDSAIHAIDAEAEAKDAPPAPMASRRQRIPPIHQSQGEEGMDLCRPRSAGAQDRLYALARWIGSPPPRTTGFVPIDAPHLAEASSAPLDAKAMGAGQDMSLLTLAEMAPDMALMAPAPAKVPEEQARSGAAHGSDGGDQGQVKEILNQPKPVAPAIKADPARLVRQSGRGNLPAAGELTRHARPAHRTRHWRQRNARAPR
jgi:conjugal transfer pilus assembly protein TraV